MTNPNPSGFVEILQSDLDEFAAKFEAIKDALQVYISKLKAQAATPLPPADEAGLKQALDDLTSLSPPLSA